MTEPVLRIVMKPYDHIAALAGGTVVATGLRLHFEFTPPNGSVLTLPLSDTTYQVREFSLAQYVLRVARGDREFIGLPIFTHRSFVHRYFFIHRENRSIRDLAALRGKRIGTNGWPETGRVWCRAALREAGVRLDDVDWFVGPLEHTSTPRLGYGNIADAPEWVRRLPAGTTLVDQLLAGKLDALILFGAPPGFDEPDCPFVRLYPDPRTAEREYYRRVRFFPASHPLVLRRDVYDQHPWIAPALFDAFEASKRLWLESLTDPELAGSSPWIPLEIEETQRLFGRDWMPHGVAANRRMLEAFCREIHEQGISERLVAVDELFADFQSVASR